MPPPTQFSLQRQGNRAGKKLRPTQIRDVIMTKEELIEQGNEILSHTKIEEKRFFNVKYTEDIVDNEYVPIVEEWIRQLQLYIINVNNNQVSEIIGSNLWILNGNRINKQRIINIIDILTEYNGV